MPAITGPVQIFLNNDQEFFNLEMLRLFLQNHQEKQ